MFIYIIRFIIHIFRLYFAQILAWILLMQPSLHFLGIFKHGPLVESINRRNLDFALYKMQNTNT